MTIRDEFAKLKTEALEIVGKETLSAEDKEAVKSKYARMTEIEEAIKLQNNISNLTIEKEAEAAIKAVVTESFKKDKLEKETVTKDTNVLDAVKKFARIGSIPQGYEKFALTSSGNSGILMPKDIPGYSVTKYVRNAYRRGLAALGVPTFSVSYTDNMTLPVFNDVSSVANNDQEGATSGVNADATYSASVTLNLVEYHSKAQWLSNKVVRIDDFDVTSSIIPAALGRIEKQEDVDWTVLVKTATAGVTTASTTAFTAAEWIDFDESLGAAYEGVPAFYVMSQSCKSALRKLSDDQHRPLLSFENGVSSYNGKPIFVSSNMDTMAANHTVAALISVDGLNATVIRDTTANEILRYENNPAYPAQVGFEAIGYSAFGFNAASIRLLKTAVS